MKKNYIFTLFLAMLSFNQVMAELCPPTGFTDGTKLYFFYDSGTSICVNRPATIIVGGSTFDISSCGDEFSVYNLTSGSAIADTSTFTVDTGFDTTCTYTDGVLPVDKFEIIFNTLKVYPNPLKGSDKLEIKFGMNLSAKFNLYDITGKLVLSDRVTNLSSKQINVSNLNNGVYMLQITTDLATTVRKIVIMK